MRFASATAMSTELGDESLGRWLHDLSLPSPAFAAPSTPMSACAWITKDPVTVS
jgi:hypothetical protein